MTLRYRLLEMTWFWDWKVKDQGHKVTNTTRWHFISNYSRASFTFARWRYQYYGYNRTSLTFAVALCSVTDKSNTAWFRTLWVTVHSIFYLYNLGRRFVKSACNYKWISCRRSLVRACWVRHKRTVITHCVSTSTIYARHLVSNFTGY